MVRAEALLERVCVVVGALDEWLASDVVFHLALGRVENLVVRASGRGVDQSAGNTCDEEGVVNLELHGVLERLLAGGEHVIKLLGLGDCSREAIEDEAARRVSMAGRAAAERARLSSP